MSSNVVSEIERLKMLLLQSTPVWIEGKDFLAFNYGDESQKHSMAGYNSRITSASGSAVIDRKTGQWRFLEPHIRLTNVSHVSTFDQTRFGLTFDEIRKAIETS